MSSTMASETESWIEVFRPFSATHAGVVLVFVLILTVAAWLGTKAKSSRARPRAESVTGALILIFWVVATTWNMWRGRFGGVESLPLHLCDFAVPLAGLALFTRRRGLRAILYFWGLALNTQAFITPLLRLGPAHAEFWLFWSMHYVIVGVAIYDLIVGRFRPTWVDYFVALTAAGIYLMIVLPVDIAFGLNYGYVGESKPQGPTVVDVLGPWPQRVVVIAVLVAAAMALLMLPWEIVRRFKRDRPAD
jgi:hypothetical integral membrane protein (TIGR02206 family)